MEHSLNPILNLVNPKVYEGRFSPYTCGIGLRSDFCHFLNKMLVPHSATRLAAPVTLTPHRVEYGVSHPLTPSSSYVTELYCTVMYCTLLYYIVLYCTVLYCIIFYCTVLYLGAQRATKSPPEELEVGGRRPPYLLAYYISWHHKPIAWFIWGNQSDSPNTKVYMSKHIDWHRTFWRQVFVYVNTVYFDMFWNTCKRFEMPAKILRGFPRFGENFKILTLQF